MRKFKVSSQANKILQHLQSGNTITPMEAMRMFGSFRLGARIYELREAGYEIERNLVTKNKKTFAEYYLV